MLTTTVSREVVESALYAADLDNDSLRDDYSGRCMYGDVCFGIVVGGPNHLARFLVALALEEENTSGAAHLASELAREVREDAMGRATIYYFPGFAFEREEEDEN